MAVKLAIEKHGWAYPSKSLAEKGGKYIHNITISQDHDNGDIVGRGDFIELDRYKEGTAEDLKAVVVDKAPNGNWYVEIVEPGTALILRNVPVITYEFNREVKHESSFYNEKDDTVRGYELAVGDIWELSPECFTTEVTIGDSVTATSGKWSKSVAPAKGGN